jgi:hypothetical protein
LKRIAAMQMLSQADSLSNFAIDKLFHVAIEQISDFRLLDGAFFKEQMAQEFQQLPALDFCK